MVKTISEEKTHDFNAVLSEIPTLVDCAVLTLTNRGTTEVMVQNDTSAVMIAIATGLPALLYCMCDAHVCGGVKGGAAHDLKIGRVHRVGSMKGEERGSGDRIYASKRYRKSAVDWLAVMERGEGQRERQTGMERGVEARERIKACWCVLQPNRRITASLALTITLLVLHSTRTHTTILFFDSCHDLSTHCQSFQSTKG